MKVSAVFSVLTLFTGLSCVSVVFTSDSQIITAEPENNVTLPCLSGSNTSVIVLEWSRQDLTEYVCLYRNGKSDPSSQYLSYVNRVELKDKLMKGGDVSVILKNVEFSDAGTYECRVFQKSNRTKRSYLKTDPISFIHLNVRVPGDGHTEDGGDKDGHVGLTVGLTVGVLLIFGVGLVVGFVMYKKYKRLNGETSYEAPAKNHGDDQ